MAKTAQITLQLDPTLPYIAADATQIEQIIMNLLINASEAMADRAGDIIVSTRLLVLDELQLANSRLQERPPAGRFACLQVTDGGCGMDAVTLQRVFDPFFTTKFTGRGLSMAAVLGIVRSHHGAIFITSTPEQGPTVQVMFPVDTAIQAADAPAPANPARAAGRPSWKTVAPCNVLIVDDEEMVRKVCAEMVRCLGGTPLLAADGDEARQVYTSHHHDIACVLLDLTMPKRDGVQVLRELQVINPAVAVILSSGCTFQDAVGRFDGLGLAGFIQKPYDVTALAHELQRIVG